MIDAGAARVLNFSMENASSAARPPLIAGKRNTPSQELAIAVLELFELLVSNARATDTNVAELEAFADEWKPRMEKLINGR